MSNAKPYRTIKTHPGTTQAARSAAYEAAKVVYAQKRDKMSSPVKCDAGLGSIKAKANSH